mgnify:CR=1 FL=1
MKLVIKNREYSVCDNCGAFKSGERCYNCHPLTAGDLDVCDQLRQYYGVPNKIIKEKKTSINEITWIGNKQQKKEPWTDTDPNKIIQHHLLQYYFTGKQLVKMGLYENAPDWQLLETTAYKHNRVINGLKLHKYKFKGTWERYKNMTEEQIRDLINNIPKEVIETFKK